MSARIWPDTLPGVIEPGFQLTPVDQSIRTDMEVGPRRLRRISTALADSITPGWKFTDAEMAAFRAWHGDRPWSLAGASDDVTGWVAENATVAGDAVVGPALQLAETVVESTATSQHRISRALPTVLADQEVQLCATLKAAGRTAARLALSDRAGTVRSVDVDLATGAVTGTSSVLSASMSDRGDGWWRVTMAAAAGTGGADPEMRVVLVNGTGDVTYTGDGSSGLSVCEINARLVTGYDLFLPTDADGAVFGAAGGSAWFTIELFFGGGFKTVEARFEGPFTAKVLSGLGWHVTARLEVRDA